MNHRTAAFLAWAFFAITHFSLRAEVPVKVGDTANEDAFTLVKSADLVVEVTGDGKFGMGDFQFTSKDKIAIKSRTTQYFDKDELVSFFSRQPKKNLIVVIFHKSTRTDEEEKIEIAKCNEYFKGRGYSRIVIQQFNGGGRPILSDITVNSLTPDPFFP